MYVVLTPNNNCTFRIRNLNRFGIIEKIQNEVIFNATSCLNPARNERGKNILRPLEMRDFYGVFAIYASGTTNTISIGQKYEYTIIYKSCSAYISANNTLYLCTVFKYILSIYKSI